MPKSSTESVIKRHIRFYFPMLTMVENIRPASLPNQYNKTGRGEYERYQLDLQNLELDAYFPTIRVGIEVQGIQHLRPSDHFHGTRIKPSWSGRLLGRKARIDRTNVQQNFQAQLERDARKRSLCEAQDVLLLAFDHADRDPLRFERRMRDVAKWGSEHTHDATLRRQLLAINWSRRPPLEWVKEWDRLAASGVRRLTRRST